MRGCEGMKSGINYNGTRKRQARFHQPKPDKTAEAVRCTKCGRTGGKASVYGVAIGEGATLYKVGDGYVCGACRANLPELCEAVA